MTGFRRIARFALVLAGVLPFAAPDAWGAATVHRFNLVLSANPSSIAATDVNDYIDQYNQVSLESRGLEGLSTIGFGWLYQAELRYFVRPNVAVGVGIGHLRSTTRREFLPRISQRIEVTAEVRTVPVHVGAAYYLAPYNQGDFQARAYFGGGVVALTGNKFEFEQLEFATDSATTLPGGSFRLKGVGESPGYYLEMGAHMFFAARWSVMLGAMYRSAEIRDLEMTYENVNTEDFSSTPVEGIAPSMTLDMSGLSVRMALGFGF